MSQLALNLRLRDAARFDTYVAGPNRQAVSHLQQLARAAAKEPVVWLWGPPGCGKTHLLHAVCAEAQPNGATPGYLDCRLAVAAGPDILAGWEMSDLMCLDDLEQVLGQRDWEQALFRLFQGLIEARGRLVVAAARSPLMLDFGLPDLASRCAAGPVYQLLALGDEDRLAALQRRAAGRGLELPVDTGQWLLRRVPRDLASLFALLDTLDVASLAAGRRLTIPFVRDVLEGSADSSPPSP